MLSPRATAKQRRAVEQDPELGKIPDAKVGAKHGLTKHQVQRIRRENGIPSAVQATHITYHRNRDAIIKDPEFETATRRILAERYHCSTTLISTLRRELNVPLQHQGQYKPHSEKEKKSETECQKLNKMFQRAGWL